MSASRRWATTRAYLGRATGAGQLVPATYLRKIARKIGASHEWQWHPRRFAPELAEEFVELIAEMMEKDPQRRIASGAIVAERLLPWYDGEVEPVPTAPTHNPWHPAPPPAEPIAATSIESPERELLSQASIDDQRSGAASTSGSATIVPPPPPIPFSPDGSELGPLTKQTDGMLIALVLAITIPTCLLIGAMIGFVVRGWM